MSLGIEQIRWPHPMRPDDLLSLTATILEIRHSATKPDLNILRWRWQMYNQNADEVLNLVATNFLDRKPIQSQR